ncbi:MAG: hypothetical protein K2J79_05965, partial [Ruminiclostridium sp.]|nr:hypothetical protein [Ruminiclostridium sp.]
MENGTVAYKCPSCNAGLTFNPKSGGFDCEYCGGHFTQEQLDSIFTASEVIPDAYSAYSDEELSKIEAEAQKIANTQLSDKEKYNDHPKNEAETQRFA